MTGGSLAVLLAGGGLVRHEGGAFTGIPSLLTLMPMFDGGFGLAFAAAAAGDGCFGGLKT